MSAPPIRQPLRRPRDYVAAILAARTLEEASALYDACPGDWLAMVRDSVDSLRAKHEALSASQRKGRPRPSRSPYYHPHPKAQRSTSNLEVGNAHLAALRQTIRNTGNDHA